MAGRDMNCLMYIILALDRAHFDPPVNYWVGWWLKMSSLVPSATVLEQWRTLTDAAAWASVDQGMLRAFNRQLGDPVNDSLPVIAIIPDDLIQQAMGSAVRGTRPFSAIEKAQLLLMINAIRAKYGQAAVSTGATTPGVTELPVNSSQPGSSKVKLKLSQIIDQGSDMEIEQLDQLTIQKARRKYIQSEGDAPLEKEEVTDAQLSCLHAKLRHDQAPFTDMGVWGPYGDRLARQMKFTSQVLKDGQWRTVEMPGASSFTAWEEAWRIFRTAAIMLNMASPSVLDRYASEFKNRVQEYPDCWHIAAQADIWCRSEYWLQEKRRQEEFHHAQPTLSVYNSAQPWNSVIKAAANATEFWHREFEKPALLYKVNGPRPMKATYDQPKGGGFPTGAPPAGERRTHEPKRRDGRFFKSTAGVNICYEWSRNENGCGEGPCPREMAHVCEWCRQPHRTVHCPQVPGWTLEKSKGKGSGKKGRGSGKGASKRPRHM